MSRAAAAALALAAVLAVALAGCPSFFTGSTAQPAPIEIDWPDAAVAPAPPP